MSYYTNFLFCCTYITLIIAIAIQQRSYIKRTEAEILRRLTKPSPGEGSILMKLLKTYVNILQELIDTYKEKKHILVSRIVYNLNNRNGPSFIQVEVNYRLLEKTYLWSRQQTGFVEEYITNITNTWRLFKEYYNSNSKHKTIKWY